MFLIGFDEVQSVGILQGRFKDAWRRVRDQTEKNQKSAETAAGTAAMHSRGGSAAVFSGKPAAGTAATHSRGGSAAGSRQFLIKQAQARFG